MFARVVDVVDHDPVAGSDVVEPGEFGFVGVAVVAGVPEDFFDLGRSLEVSGDGRVREAGADELNGRQAEKEQQGKKRDEAAWRGRIS